MKKGILFLLILTGLNSSIFGQNITLSEPELESVLTKQWTIEFAMVGSMKIGQMPGAKDFDFIFKKDKKYDIIEEDGSTKSGTWKYDMDKNYVELSINGKTTSRIKSIDKNKLILTMVSGKNDPPGLPSVEVHFKPI